MRLRRASFIRVRANEPNMTVCSIAVLHLLAQRTQWNRKQIRKNDELKNHHAYLRNRGSPCSRANRRGAALSRSVQRLKGARLSAGLDRWLKKALFSRWCFDARTVKRPER